MTPAILNAFYFLYGFSYFERIPVWNCQLCLCFYAQWWLFGMVSYQMTQLYVRRRYTGVRITTYTNCAVLIYLELFRIQFYLTPLIVLHTNIVFMENKHKLTKLGKNSGLRICIVLTTWNMSTSSSISIFSNTRLSATKTPLLLQPSLIKQKYRQT